MMNHRDHQAHALDERPVHSRLPPVRFNTMAELLEADAPRDPVRVEKWRIICPDNSVWPISSYGLQEYNWLQAQEGEEERPPHSLEELRALKYQEYCEAADQRAIYDASNRDNAQGYQSWLTFALGSVACIVLLIIAAILLIYKLEGETAAEPQAALLGLPALGAVLPRPKKEKAPAESVPADGTEPKRTRKKLGPWIPGTIFDHPALGGKTWDALLPYDEWMAYLPENCLYRPDIPKFRKLGALFGGAVGGGVLMAAGSQLGGIVPLGIMGAVVGSVVGALFGWVLVAPVLAGKPRILAARVIDDGGQRTLLPVEHNFCRTVGVSEYLDNLQGYLERVSAGEGGEEEDEYNPNTFRATTLYHDMQDKDVRAELSSPPEALQKIQLGLTAVMAFGAVGLLIFASLATTPGG